MKLSATMIGIVVACLGLAIGATLEGSNIIAVLNPAALLIVLGGTLGATIAGTSLETSRNIPTLYRKAFAGDPPDLLGRVRELVGYAEKARRDGLLALEAQVETMDDAYTRKGLQLVVDGTDPELVSEVLEIENSSMRKRHLAGVQPFEKAGGFAPTMGIIGTVFGLVHVLENLDSPETLGPAISAAFIATLLGVASANVVYLPVANRLRQLSQEELQFRAMTLEGILAIQAGDNPRVLEEKLMAYVPPAMRPGGDEVFDDVADLAGSTRDDRAAA